MTSTNSTQANGKHGQWLRTEPEAEKKLIGSLVQSWVNDDADCPDRVFQIVRVADFHDPAYRAIARAMHKLAGAGEPLDPRLIVEALNGAEVEQPGYLMLEARESVIGTAGAEGFARIVAAAAEQRRAVCVVNDALNDLRTKADTADVIIRLQDRLGAVNQRKTPRRRCHNLANQPFPEVLSTVNTYIREASTAIGCAREFVALPLLGCLARAIGNKRTIRLKRTWEEPVIIWAAIVGRSGSHKSPALAAATAHLARHQSSAIANYAEAEASYEQHRAIYDREYQAWKRAKTTDPPPWEPEPPVCERFIAGDATIEALAAILAEQFDGLCVVRDELAGWLDGMSEYKGGKGSDTAHWLAAWSGAQWVVDRKTASKKMLHVPRASISLVGGIQPGVLQRAIGREHMTDGLCARLLLAMPEPQPVVWTESTIDPATEAAMGNIFARLLSLEPAADEHGNAIPYAIPLTPEAKAVWTEYFNRHRAELVELDDDLAACWSKLEAYAARFALIFQLCSWADGEASEHEIDETSIEAGINLSEWFGQEARRVYGMIAETIEERETRELVELVARKGGEVTARELSRSSRVYQPVEAAEDALDSLAKAGYGRWRVSQAGPQGGKPVRSFSLSDPVDS